jgi:hypothetical protein
MFTYHTQYQFLHLNTGFIIQDSPECTAHCFIIHVGFIFVQSPQARHGFRVNQLEDSFLSIGPLDEAGAVFSVLKQFE